MEQKPYLVVEWNDTETDAVGWMCVYNFVNNYTGGGTRMHPTVTREEVIRLATTMGYKYKAAESETTGGCKGGIKYDYRSPDANEVLYRYILAMTPYIKAGVSLGGDLGVNYSDVLEMYDELGIGLPQTKEMAESEEIKQNIKNHDELSKMKYDGFLMYDMITGYGVAAAADETWKLRTGKSGGGKVVIQGFGAVGASLANSLVQMGYKVVGISDANLLVECQEGLDVEKLIETRKPKGELDENAFEDNYKVHSNDDWLDIDCDILIPAALEDVIHEGNVDQVKASVVVEAANIPVTVEAERILEDRGVDIAIDFLANLGGIRIYEVAVFGLVPNDPKLVVEDTETLIRKNIKKVYNLVEDEGIYARDAALELFAPDKSDIPDI